MKFDYHNYYNKVKVDLLNLGLASSQIPNLCTCLSFFSKHIFPDNCCLHDV